MDIFYCLNLCKTKLNSLISKGYLPLLTLINNKEGKSIEEGEGFL